MCQIFIMQARENLTSTFKISSLEILIIAAFFTLNLELCLCACVQTEYETHGRCCPLCAPGNRVYRHCTDDTSTTCDPCLHSTYIADPNGLEKCFNCLACDPGSGLRVKTQCTSSSDTVCEPLERHYCIDQVRGSCTQAEKHTACSPGHYIQQEGTALKDTVCGVCTAGTYSDGSVQTCQPHSKCEDLGLVEIKAGTSSTDAECGERISVGVVAGIITVVVVVVAAAVVAAVGVGVFLKKTYKPVPPAGNHGVQSSGDTDSECEEVVCPLKEEQQHVKQHSQTDLRSEGLTAGAEAALSNEPWTVCVLTN